MISASDVAKLRASTGAGMMDCKKALEEAGGDMEVAAELLRKKGIVKAAKRADKIAAEGTTLVKADGSTAVVLEVNSETDFVAKSDDFKNLVEELTSYLLQNKPASMEDAMSAVQEKLNSATAKIGEKIALRRFAVVEKSGNDAFGVYSHMGGKISVLIHLTGTTDEDFAREIAMHAAAANPKFVDRSEVSSEAVEKEKEIYTEQLKQQGKPEAAIPNILKGKLDKYYSEVCLLEQPFIKDEEKTIAKLLAEKGAGVKVAKMVRYELGEGIEKKGNDFAADVESQLQ